MRMKSHHIGCRLGHINVQKQPQQINLKVSCPPHPVSPTYAYLYFDWPGEVADVNKEGDINIAPKVKFFIGEAVLELFNIAAGDNMNLFSRLSTS